jgi:hypothetical protein
MKGAFFDVRDFPVLQVHRVLVYFYDDHILGGAASFGGLLVGRPLHDQKQQDLVHLDTLQSNH